MPRMTRAALERSLSCLLLSSTLGATPINAQEMADRTLSCIIDSAKSMRADTLGFYLTPWGRSGEKDSTALRVARVISAYYQHAPGTPVALRSWTGARMESPATPSKKRRPRGEVSGAVVEIRFGDGSGVVDLNWLGPRVSPAVEAEVTAAVHAADSAGEWTSLSGLASTAQRLALVDSYDPNAAGVPVLRVAVRYLVIDEPARVKAPFRPRYPLALQANGINGHVDLAFIISVDGRAEPGSLQIVGGSNQYEEFVESAREAVLRTTFTPARVQGCAVRQYVNQRISFRL